MKKIIILVALAFLCLMTIAADYNITASKTITATVLKMKMIHLDPSDMTLKVDYCWVTTTGAEKDCDNATDQMKETDAIPVLLKAKALMKAKEKI